MTPVASIQWAPMSLDLTHFRQHGLPRTPEQRSPDQQCIINFSPDLNSFPLCYGSTNPTFIYLLDLFYYWM